MKFKVLLVSVLFAISASVFASGEKSAFTIWIDEACWWFMGDDIVANADLHGVLLSNGQWKVNCHGEVVEGTLPGKAMVLHSSSKKPTGLCCVETIGCTENVHVTVTPYGESTFICHGTVD